MKKLLSIALFMSLTLAGQSAASAATTHTVNKGDTYYKIASQYGVSVTKLMSDNNAKNSLIHVGQKLTVPSSSVTNAEKDLLARLVESEAKGESYAGKVAVATVILNRVDSPLFPNSIKSVIYQTGQFTPVANGKINQPASDDSIRAVNEALAFRGQGKGSLYFYNPKKTTNQWLRAKQTTVVIGDHVFAK